MSPFMLPAWLQFLVDHQLAQPAVTLLVGLVAAIFAIVTVLTSRWVTRMRATLDILERLETQDYYQTTYRAFRKVRLETNGIQRIIQISTGSEKTERDQSIEFLNIYEFIALGIRNGILDEKFFRGAYEPNMLRDWAAAKPLIDDIRHPADRNMQGEAAFYEHFQWLVDRWEHPRPMWKRVMLPWR